MNQRPEKKLDLRGLKCPLPVLRTRKALAGSASGDVLVVACTDPLAGIDIPTCYRGPGMPWRIRARTGAS